MSQPQPGFLVSPELLGKVRSTIARVDGEPTGGKTWTIPTRFEEEERAGKVFRICAFTGAWSIGALKTITFKNVTSTPNTVVAVNLFAAVPAPTGSRDCAIAREGTAWYLVETLRDTEQEFRIVTFTGNWAINSNKTVTFKNQTATPNTVVATNLFCGLAPLGTVDAAIAKDGTAWYLVQPRLTQLPGFASSGTQVLAVVGGNLRFVGTTAC